MSDAQEAVDRLPADVMEQRAHISDLLWGLGVAKPDLLDLRGYPAVAKAQMQQLVPWTVGPRPGGACLYYVKYPLEVAETQRTTANIIARARRSHGDH